MKKEKIIAYISKYLFATAIITTLGLVKENRGFRGFPFAWLQDAGAGHIEIPRFIMSLAAALAIVIAVDIITKTIIRVREPSLKTLTKEASLYPIAYSAPANEEIEELAEDPDAEFIAESEMELIDEDDETELLIGEEIPEPKLKSLLGNTSAHSQNNSGQGAGAVIATVVIIAIIAVIMAAISDTDDSYDETYNHYLTDDIALYGTDNDEYAEHISMNLSDLFYDMETGENPLRDFTSEESDALYSLGDWEYMIIEPAQIFVYEDKKAAISKLIISDGEDDKYLAAVLMDVERTEQAEYNEEYDEIEEYAEYDIKIKGMAVCPAEGEKFVSDVTESGSGNLTAEDIKDAVNLGQTTYEGVNILLWTGGEERLHLEAEEAEAA